MVFFLFYIVGIVIVIVGKLKLGFSIILICEWLLEYVVNIMVYFILIFFIWL